MPASCREPYGITSTPFVSRCGLKWLLLSNFLTDRSWPVAASCQRARQPDAYTWSGAAERLNHLVDQSQATTGVLQAQLAGNQINAELAGRITSLRPQLALQGQAHTTALEMRVRTRTAQADITRQFFGGKMK